jgi:hypothetical protein
MQMNLEFKGSATIEHLNVRKEGAEKDILAIDVKVRGEAPSDILFHLLGCSKAKAKHFWDEKSDEQRGAYGGLALISTWTEFENCVVVLGQGKTGRTFKGVKVRRFAFYPANYLTLKLTCQLQISDIHDADLAFICELVHENIAITITGEPGLFDDNEN